MQEGIDKRIESIEVGSEEKELIMKESYECSLGATAEIRDIKPEDSKQAKEILERRVREDLGNFEEVHYDPIRKRVIALYQER